MSFVNHSTTDLACVDDGVLTVIRIAEYDDCQYVDGDGGLITIDMAKSDSAGSGATAERFHTP